MNQHDTFAALPRAAALAAMLALLAACGGGSGGDGDTTPPPASPGFELKLDAASVPVRQDSRGLLRVRVERQAGFSGAVEVTLANPPAGVDAGIAIVEPHEDEALLPLRLLSDVPLGAQTVVVSGSGGGASATANLQLDVQAPQPDSQSLIRAALDAGQIDLGTSLLYRAYAVFGDPLLPEAFVGSGSAGEDIALFVDIEDARPTLPQSILDQLAPYLARPDDPASVFNEGQPTQRRERPTAAPLPAAERCTGGQREWITSRSELHPVRAWALCLGTQSADEDAQNNLFRVISVVNQAYGKMVTLMAPAIADQWGDEAIDVYVVPNTVLAPRPNPSPNPNRTYSVRSNRGIAFPQPPFAGGKSSGFVMMPMWHLAQPNYQLTLIHELFHILQFAHTYRLTTHWFTEASAEWSAAYFNREAGIRHADNEGLHKESFGGFQSSPHGLLSTANLYHPYQSYVWPLFVEQDGNAGKIGSAWQLLQGITSHATANDEIDSVMPFKDNFRKFAVRNWNESLLPGDPIATRYKKLDDPFPAAGQYPPTPVAFRDLVPNRPQTLPTELEPLQAKYYRFDVSDESGIQSVEFDFTGLSGREHLNVDALIRNVGDQWFAKPVSLDGEPKPLFCFDLGPSNETVRGSFVELRLVLSNHAHAAGSTVSGNFEVRPSRGGCAGWTGEIRWSLLSDVAGVRTDASTIASVTFKVDEDPPGGSTPGVVQYKVSRGNVKYRAEVTTPACRDVATAEVEMNPDATSGKGATVASLATFSTNGVPQYGAFSGATFGDITVTGNCTPSGSEETRVEQNKLIPWWNNLTGTFAYDLKEEGMLMQEDVSVQSDFSGARSQWNLRKTGK